jgi:hypothetical protein
MRRRPAQPMAELVEILTAKHGIGKPTAEQAIREAWPEIVGHANASYSHAVRIDERRRLIVHASHAVVRNELFHQAFAPHPGVIWGPKFGLAPRGPVFEVIPLRQWEPFSWGPHHDWCGIPPHWNGDAGEARGNPGLAGGTGPAKVSYSRATQLHNNAYSR